MSKFEHISCRMHNLQEFVVLGIVRRKKKCIAGVIIGIIVACISAGGIGVGTYFLGKTS